MGFGQFVNEMLEPTCECGGALMEDGTCSECGAKSDMTAASPEFDQPSEFPEISEAKKKPEVKPTEKAKPGERSKTFPFAKVKGKEEKEPTKPGKKLSKSEQARKNFGLDKKK